MRPIDLAAERDRRARAARRALGHEVRQACLNATQAEAVQLGKLVHAVRSDLVTVGDARSSVALLRDEQRARRSKAA